MFLLSLSRAAASPASPRGRIVHVCSYMHALQWGFFVLHAAVAVVLDAAPYGHMLVDSLM